MGENIERLLKSLKKHQKMNVEYKNRQARATLEQLVKNKSLRTITLVTDKDCRGKRYLTT